MYKDMTEAVTRMALDGKGRSFLISFGKYFMSLMCDGRLPARGWIKCVMYAERWSVGPSHPETIEWRGQSGL